MPDATQDKTRIETAALVDAILANEVRLREAIDSALAAVEAPRPIPSARDIIAFSRSREGRERIAARLTSDEPVTEERLSEAVLNIFGAYGTQFQTLQDIYFNVNDGGGYETGPAMMPPLYQPNMKRGEVIPVYRTEAELRFIRDRSRILVANNEFALCAVENRVNYVIGDGFKYTVAPRRADCKADVNAAVECNAVLEAWQEINDLPTLEADVCRRLDEDGEAFIRRYTDSDGFDHLRAIEPEHVRSPTGEEYGPDWSFGVHTLEDDIETVRGYGVVDNPIDNPMPREVKAREILHLKLNTKRTSKRGLPTFYPIESNLRRCEDLLASMGHIARARAKIALIRKVAGLTSPTATALVNRLTAIKASDPTTGEELNVERLRYGTILTTGQNVEYEFPNAGVGASDIVEVLQAELRACASRLQMPEWMFTALADAKYSNAFVVEAPTYKSFRRIQRLMREGFGLCRYGHRAALAWRQLKAAVKKGLISSDSLKRVKLQCEGPALEARDRTQEVTRHKELVAAGFESTQTAQKSLELDPEIEAPLIAADKVGKARPTQDLNAVVMLQQAYTAGKISRAAGVASLEIMLGFDRAHAEALLPLEMPFDRTPKPATPGGPGGAPGEPGAPPGAGADAGGGDAGGAGAGDDADNLLTQVGQEAGGASNGPAPGQQPNPTQQPGMISEQGGRLRENVTDGKKHDHGNDGKFVTKGGSSDAAPKGDAGSTKTPVGGFHPAGGVVNQFAHPKGFKPTSSGNAPNPHAPDETRPELTKDEAEALRAYSDIHIYGKLNEQIKEQLRAGKTPAKKGALGKMFGDGPGEVHEKLQSAFAKAPPINPPVVVKRGITVRDPEGFAKFFSERAAAGGLIALPGYQSTSAVDLGGKDPVGAGGGYAGNVKFSIHATHGLDLKPYSKFPNEHEMLLPHGSEYAVGRVEKHGNDWHVELFQVHPHAAKAKAA